jgi:hypothetical protein
MSSMPLVVGVDYATKKYGGMEYAMAVTIAVLHPSWANRWAYATLIWITADTTSTIRQSKSP